MAQAGLVRRDAERDLALGPESMVQSREATSRISAARPVVRAVRTDRAYDRLVRRREDGAAGGMTHLIA